MLAMSDILSMFLKRIRYHILNKNVNIHLLIKSSQSMPTKIKAKLSNVTDESNLEEYLIFFVCF